MNRTHIAAVSTPGLVRVAPRMCFAELALRLVSAVMVGGLLLILVLYVAH